MSISKHFLCLSTSLIASAFICGVVANHAEAFGLYQQTSDGSSTFIDLNPDFSKAIKLDGCELFGGRSCYEAELPNYLKELIIQDITQDSGVAPIGFQVTRAQHVTWSNGCMGNDSPGMMCSMALVPEWRVTAEDSLFRRNYSVVRTSVSLISQERIYQATNLDPGSVSGQSVPEPGTVWGSLSAMAIAVGMRKFSKRKTSASTAD